MEQENRMNLRLPLVDVTNGAASLAECKREVEFSVNFGAGPLGIEFQPENEVIGCQVLNAAGVKCEKQLDIIVITS